MDESFYGLIMYLGFIVVLIIVLFSSKNNFITGNIKNMTNINIQVECKCECSRQNGYWNDWWNWGINESYFKLTNISPFYYTNQTTRWGYINGTN
jgi:hypothetical protein